jgi:hypothetical protein
VSLIHSLVHLTTSLPSAPSYIHFRSCYASIVIDNVQSPAVLPHCALSNANSTHLSLWLRQDLASISRLLMDKDSRGHGGPIPSHHNPSGGSHHALPTQCHVTHPWCFLHSSRANQQPAFFSLFRQLHLPLTHTSVRYHKAQALVPEAKTRRRQLLSVKERDTGAILTCCTPSEFDPRDRLSSTRSPTRLIYVFLLAGASSRCPSHSS